MKAFTQTIIVFVALNLAMTSSTLAQNAPDEEKQASKEALLAKNETELTRREAEIAAKVAQKEEEATRKQTEAAAKKMQAAEEQMRTAKKKMQAQQSLLEDVQKLVELKIPEIELAIPRVSIPVWQQSGGGAVLVVPAAELKVEDLATITEDMTVMSRIFDNKLSQARLTTGRRSWYVEDYNPFLGRDSGTIEAIYLEGYGALFLMKVNVLLSPPPEALEEKETEEEDADPLWTETKQEIYAPEELSRRQIGRSEEKEKYDAEKVEELKETLIKTLKHAANIRALKPDQSVILTVIGGRSQSATMTIRRSGVYNSRGRTRIVQTAPGAQMGLFSPTVLTIRAKKSDIDAFSKGQLDFDQFLQKILVEYL